MHMLVRITLYLYLRYLLLAASVFSVMYNIFMMFAIFKFYKLFIMIVVLVLLICVVSCRPMNIIVVLLSLLFLSAICKDVLLIYVICYVYMAACYFLYILTCPINTSQKWATFTIAAKQ
jgi:hypothetical protein